MTAAAGRRREIVHSSHSGFPADALHPIRKVTPHKPVTESNCNNGRLPYCEYGVANQVPNGPSDRRYSIEVRSSGQAVTLKLAGASPLKDFDRAPNVVVRAGDRELGRFSPSAAFEKTIEIPADALAASSGKLTVETDLTFSPAERFGGADTRRLGLKLREVSIQKR